LLERLVLMAADENNTVLDLFAGTGTVVATKKSGGCYNGFVSFRECRKF
jgi:DNA modification methylase